MLLVVVENTLDGLDTWVLVALIILAGTLLVPVEDLCTEISARADRCRGVRSQLSLTRPTKGEIRVTPASAQATA